ncbi:MAG TPA: hypothetical protein V6C78_26120 [Crinalium sp.]|jgi:hypothetical protein
MFTNNLLKLEQAISRLSREEQLWLVERVIHNLRINSPDVPSVSNGQVRPTPPASPIPAPPITVESKPVVPPKTVPTNNALSVRKPTSPGLGGQPTLKELDPKVQAHLRAIDDAIAELDALDS